MEENYEKPFVSGQRDKAREMHNAAKKALAKAKNTESSLREKGVRLYRIPIMNGYIETTDAKKWKEYVKTNKTRVTR